MYMEFESNHGLDEYYHERYTSKFKKSTTDSLNCPWILFDIDFIIWST